VNRICIYIRMWDVDPARASPSVGGPERVACGERVAEAEAARGAAVRMRGGCGGGWVGLMYLHESAAHGCGCGAGPGHELLTTPSVPSRHRSESESD
jgi:hypothetical protein